MAEKDYEIILKWDKDNKVWRPIKYPKDSNVAKFVKKGIRGLGRTTDGESLTIPNNVIGHPKVKMEDEFTGNEITGTIIYAPESVLAQYSNAYASIEPKPEVRKTETKEAEKLTAGEAVSQIRGRASGKEQERKKVETTAEEFSAREFVETSQVDTPIPTSLPKSGYTKQEILANGTTVDSGRNDGTQVFNFLLEDPNTIDPTTGMPVKVPLEAVLLPETDWRKQSSTGGTYYVASMDDAISTISQDYIRRKNVADLKKQLWEANFLSTDQYNQSIRGNMANVFDEFASAGLRAALESVSVKNFPTLVQGRGALMGLPDHLNDMFTPGGIPTNQIGLPSTQSINEILDDTYQTYYGRKPTSEEYEAFGQEVQKYALENARRQIKAVTPEGAGVTFFQGQEVFTEADLQQVAEGLTRGNPERKAYYGVQEYGKAFDRVFGTGGGLSSQTELTELLR